MAEQDKETLRDTKQAAQQTQQAAAQTQQAAQRTQTAARVTAVAAQATKTSAERTTELAADRTALAFERTYAAWVRTGLVALASGVGAAKLLDGVAPGWTIRLATASLLLFAVFCFVAAVWRIVFDVVAPEPGVPHIPRWLLAIVNGALTLTTLVALYGAFAVRGF